MTKFVERRKQTRSVSINKKIAVLYHNNCSDGFGAAWAAWKKLGKRAEYIGVSHDGPPPLGLFGKKIYLVDFCYGEADMRELIKANERVTAIEHHISMEKAVKMTQDFVFDNDHSGSVLSWMYFHPGKKVPKMLRYIEDIDLWHLRLPYVKEVLSALDLYNFDFRIWSQFAENFENKSGAKKIIEKGRMVLAHEQKLIERLVANNAELVEFQGVRTYAVNSPNFDSQIAAELYKKLPPMGIVWRERRGKIKVSLRSDGSLDVSKLAAKYGGGGHKGSSGFVIPVNKKLPWRWLNKQ